MPVYNVRCILKLYYLKSVPEGACVERRPQIRAIESIRSLQFGYTVCCMSHTKDRDRNAAVRVEGEKYSQNFIVSRKLEDAHYPTIRRL